jgi:hypothetical protein
MKRWIAPLAVLAGLVLIPTLALTQDAGQNGGRRRGGGGGNFDPAAFRERQLNNIKEQMGATDQEWNALKPKVEKVMDAQRDAFVRMGGMGGRGAGGGPGGGGPGAGGGAANQPESKVAQAQADLRKVLDNKDAGAPEIDKALKAFRDARDKARADLKAAQKDLQVSVNKKQEAALVLSGLLD